jgi:putative transposase
MMTFYRRHLPHWQPAGYDLFITWRLHGSLPANFRPPNSVGSTGREFLCYDRVLDGAGIGPLWLKDPRVAQIVVKALEDAQASKLLRLRAYVLMANHVHVLAEPLATLAKITHQVKGATAFRANLILARTRRRFWQDESFDRWVRNPAEWEKTKKYIENNPVAAGLVRRPEDWPWSSASRPLK